MEIGSFIITSQEYKTHTVYTVKYKPQFYPIYQWQFFQEEHAIVFAEEKTRIDRKLLR